MIEIRTAAREDWPAISRVDMQAFGYTVTPEEQERNAEQMDFDRFRIAVDDGDIVGVAGSC